MRGRRRRRTVRMAKRRKRNEREKTIEEGRMGQRCKSSRGPGRATLTV
jgi:hypothetical protein